MKTIATKCLLMLWICVFAACEKANRLEENCEPRFCTFEYRFIVVRFKDQTGNFTLVDNYKVTHKASGKILNNSKTLTDPDQKYYLILEDSDKNQYKEEGEEFVVSASHPITKKTASAVFKIAGGKCACHIEKLSGPDEIIFE